MSGAFQLPLAPPETLGRRFQYALLSIDPNRVVVDEVRGYAVFNTVSDYLDLVAKALDALKGLVVVQKGGRGRGGCQTQAVRGIDCCSLHRGPSLYSAGGKIKIGGQTYAGDYLTLHQAGFTTCQYTTTTGKVTVAWNHAAVSYADMVLNRGSPLDGQAPDLPWLAKATTFGKKLRAPGGGRAGAAHSLTLDVLGSVLLGGALSFLWSGRLGDLNAVGSQRRGRQAGKRKPSKSIVEFYLVPDAVHHGFWTLRAIMLQSGMSRGTMARALRLAREYSVSVEVAMSIMLAKDLASSLGPASQISSYLQATQLERVATVVTNIRQSERQKRPLVMSVIPLSLAVYAAFSEHSVKALSAASAAAMKAKVQGLKDVMGKCLSAMYLQAANPRWSDHLSSCVRSLYAAADSVESESPDLAKKLRWVAARLAKDYIRLQSRAWG